MIWMLGVVCRFTRGARFGVSLAVLCIILSGWVGVSSASAASPWWSVSSGARPSVLQPGPCGGRGEHLCGQIVVQAVNLGDADTNGEVSPVTLADSLPQGLKVLSVEGEAGAGGPYSRGPVSCVPSPVSCTFAGTLPPFDQIEMYITVEVLSGYEQGSLGMNTVSVSGGGAPAASASHEVDVSEEPLRFGMESSTLRYEEEGGGLDTQAGSHPYQQTLAFTLNQGAAKGNGSAYMVEPVGLPKELGAELPAGVIGDPNAVPKCAMGQFLTRVNEGNHLVDACPASTAVGVAMIEVQEPSYLGTTLVTVPIFNLEPGYGEPARFGFYITEAEIPVLIDTAVRSNGDYGITATTTGITETAATLGVRTTFWGVPGGASHDSARGWGCLSEARGLPHSPCTPAQEHTPPALLTMPTSCAGPLHAFVFAASWLEPSQVLEYPVSEAMPALAGCNRLPFAPDMSAEPTTRNAASASGLNFNLDFHDEGLLSPEGLAQSQLATTVVKLPEGLTIDPSAGIGLVGCRERQFAEEAVREKTPQEKREGKGCPDEAELGTVEIQTPLLTQAVDGVIYVAQPYENRFDSLVALYVVARNPETGVLVRLAGKVTPNPTTGQLTTTFEGNPQLPFDHFNFHFREGQQAPLITPATCGTYETEAASFPWSEPSESLVELSAFKITAGVGGGPCPAGGTAPFDPQIVAGMVNNNAGAYSELYVRLSRTDGEQEISRFSTVLPPGMSGILAGVPYCPEADIEAARHESGAQEESQPSCPSASQIGHTEVGTGVGAVLAYVSGAVYLAGPFNGKGPCAPGEGGCAPFSIVSITGAKVGPFDLGTVVLRFGLNIDPTTAQVSVDPSTSEAIPTIIDGIVTHVRDIRVYIDRPNFTVNPTSCEKSTIASTLQSSEGASATVDSSYQPANCASLKFEPEVSATVSGKVSRSEGTSFAIRVTKPVGQGEQADLRRLKLELPAQLPSRLTTLQKACPAGVFEANPAACPAASVIGHMRAVTPLLSVPVEGPMYFVSHGNEAFPSIEIVLQGDGVKVILVGQTYISSKGITSSTFASLPDVPFSLAEASLHNGPYSALTALGDLCATTTTTIHRKTTIRVRRHGHSHVETVTRTVKRPKPKALTMPTEMVAQGGGKPIQADTPVSVTGCSAGKHKPTGRQHAKRHARKK